MLHTTRRNFLGSAAMLLTATAAIASSGCGKRDDSAPATTPVAGRLAVVATVADTSRPASEAGLPRGYHAALDDASAKVSDIAYSEKERGRWEVKTGPAHILYSPADTAKTRYIASATFEQLDAPAHPEAFGVFFGGSKLGSAAARYTYFLVRGDGSYMVKVRDGSTTRTITDWTAQPSIPKQDAAGRALYGIRIEVRDKAANVSVNGIPVATITGRNIPLDGIAGVRINHNLHLVVTPVSLIR